MALINGMVVSDGGVCLKEHYSYYTYDKISDSITNHPDVNLLTGEYILPYNNRNQNFYMYIYDAEICLILGDTEPMSEWIDNYINSLATTGYTGGYDDSTIEGRVIYDKLNNSYYKVDHIVNSIDYPSDKTEIWAIVDEAEEVWVSGTTDYYYNELDSCGLKTGRQLIKIKNINEKSPTRYLVKYIDKKPDIKLMPTVTTDQNVTLITINSADVNGIVLTSGSTSVSENGFCYSIYTSPDTNDIKIPVSSGVGAINKTLTSLVSSTTYYVRAYAINSIGIEYGNEVSFKTL